MTIGNKGKDPRSPEPAVPIAAPGASDLLARHFPISIKGVVEVDGKVVLLKNERDEWELPGGKLEEHEEPADCLEREIFEELNLRVRIDSLLDVWVYNVLNSVKVFIVTYGAHSLDSSAEMRISNEHTEVGLVGYDEIASLNMPMGYKNSIDLFNKSKNKRGR
jgi:8-oxo-dGTP pyrophosphatase MutT (NUDIX family)